MQPPRPTALRDDSGRSEPARERSRLRRPASAPRRIRSTELFGGRPSVVIEHGGLEYRLQITRLGKLILTK